MMSRLPFYRLFETEGGKLLLCQFGRGKLPISIFGTIAFENIMQYDRRSEMEL